MTSIFLTLWREFEEQEAAGAVSWQWRKSAGYNVHSSNKWMIFPLSLLFTLLHCLSARKLLGIFPSTTPYVLRNIWQGWQHKPTYLIILLTVYPICKRVFTMDKRADIKWWISIIKTSYPARYVTCPEVSFSPGQVAILQPHWGFTYPFHDDQWTEGANVPARHRLCAHNCFSQWMMYAQWLTGSGVQTGPFLGFTIKVRIRWVLTGHHSTMVI